MRAIALLLAVVLFMVVGPACGSSTDSHSEFDCIEECGLCSTTSQCCAGWSCVGFTDGLNRCSRIGRTCP
jgi:hypothetical protein